MTRKFLFTVDYMEFGQRRLSQQFLKSGENLDVAKMRLIEHLKSKGVKPEFIEFRGCAEQI